MRRLHLFELEDQPWLPRRIRDGATDLLDVAFARMRMYDEVASELFSLLDRTRDRHIVDLCSGGGGGTLAMVRRLRADGRAVDVMLTDRYPSEAGMARVQALGDARVRYVSAPLDASDSGGAPEGVRTCSSAVHHFMPEDVRSLIAIVVARRQPLAFFDVAASPAMRRLPRALLPLPMAMNMVVLFVAALALAPSAKPHRWSRLLFTYLLPAIPIVFAWDGTVSALRAYLPEELLTLARSVPGADGYEWRAGVKGRALYLTGIPRNPERTADRPPPDVPTN